MIKQEIKFDFDDLLIVPAASSYVTSRKDVSVYDENDMLPLLFIGVGLINDVRTVIFQSPLLMSIFIQRLWVCVYCIGANFGLAKQIALSPNSQALVSSSMNLLGILLNAS